MYRATAAVLLGLALVTAVLELGAALLLSLAAPEAPSNAPPGAGPPLADAPVSGASSPYFATVDWGTRHWRELEVILARTRYEPYVMWRRAPVRGTTITVDSLGIRPTPGADCGPRSLRVFVFGGSTTWGYGVPDWATIPAYLQREVSARTTRPVCVVNLADLGYTSTQSLVQLMVRLRDGDVPGIAIFYDGVNDVTSADLYDEAGLHGDMNAIERRLDAGQPSWWESFALGQLARYLFGVGHEPPRDRYRHTLGVSAPGMAQRAAAVYLANHKMARTLADEFDFMYLAFWQPNALVGSKPFTREETIIREAGRPGRRVSSGFIAEVYRQVRAAADSSEHLHYIADLFEGETRLLYMDWQHLVPEGNELVARRIVRAMDEEGVLTAVARD